MTHDIYLEEKNNIIELILSKIYRNIIFDFISHEINIEIFSDAKEPKQIQKQRAHPHLGNAKSIMKIKRTLKIRSNKTN